MIAILIEWFWMLEDVCHCRYCRGDIPERACPHSVRVRW